MTPPDSWPASWQYEEAIQTPGLFFTDADLRAAKIENDANGVPASSSGGSAIVFKATVCSDDLAIRCFTRSAPTVQQRYTMLGEYLKSDERTPPDYFVDFNYRHQGVMVEGVCYPLLRMNWSPGRPLRSWVAGNRAHGKRLRALAGRWRNVMDDLQIRRIAHGDLASDNCLVRGESDFTLIDYDGCFTEKLAHADPRESGHPDYQHPRRRSYYGPNMDAFPALVIYLSLLAVAADLTLWDSNNDDVNLIFSAADYKRPGETYIWSRLRNSPDSTVRRLTDALATMCTMPIETLPPLSQVLKDCKIPVEDAFKCLDDDGLAGTEKIVRGAQDDLEWVNNPGLGIPMTQPPDPDMTQPAPMDVHQPPPGSPPSQPGYLPPAPPVSAGYSYGQAGGMAVPVGMYLDQASGLTLPQGVELASTGRRIGAYFLAIPLSIVTLFIGYIVWGLIVWANGQTPALQMLGMRCWRPEDGRVAGWGWMALREVVGRMADGVLSFVTLLVSFILMLTRPDRRCLHDLIAGTVVLYDPNKVLGAQPPQVPPPPM